VVEKGGVGGGGGEGENERSYCEFPTQEHKKTQSLDNLLEISIDLSLENGMSVELVWRFRIVQ